MNKAPEELLDEYTRLDGYVCTLTKYGDRSFDVDMWTSEGNNHWNRHFNSEAGARVEFEWWRNV